MPVALNEWTKTLIIFLKIRNCQRYKNRDKIKLDDLPRPKKHQLENFTMNVRTWQIVQKKRKKVVFAQVTFLNGMFHIYHSGYIIKRSNITFRERGKLIVRCSVVKGLPVCKTFTGFQAMRLKNSAIN